MEKVLYVELTRDGNFHRFEPEHLPFRVRKIGIRVLQGEAKTALDGVLRLEVAGTESVFNLRYYTSSIASMSLVQDFALILPVRLEVSSGCLRMINETGEFWRLGIYLHLEEGRVQLEPSGSVHIVDHPLDAPIDQFAGAVGNFLKALIRAK